MVAVSLVPNGGYVSATNANRISWIVGSLVFLLTMAALVIWMSGRFVRPIEESLAAIRDEENLEGRRSGISEIDALLDFVREKLQN